MTEEYESIADFCEKTGIEPSDDILLAASYLQARGWKFGYNFGIDNALALAEEVMQTEMGKGSQSGGGGI